MKLTRAKEWIASHQFASFIAVALVMVSILTSVSMWLYVASGASKLDLSRPGYESVRTKVQDNNDSTDTYPSTGSIDKKSIDDFRNRYEKIKSRLDATNSYDAAILEDENLGLIPVSNTTDTTEQ